MDGCALVVLRFVVLLLQRRNNTMNTVAATSLSQYLHKMLGMLRFDEFETEWFVSCDAVLRLTAGY